MFTISITLVSMPSRSVEKIRPSRFGLPGRKRISLKDVCSATRDPIERSLLCALRARCPAETEVYNPVGAVGGVPTDSGLAQPGGGEDRLVGFISRTNLAEQFRPNEKFSLK